MRVKLFGLTSFISTNLGLENEIRVKFVRGYNHAKLEFSLVGDHFNTAMAFNLLYDVKSLTFTQTATQGFDLDKDVNRIKAVYLQHSVIDNVLTFKEFLFDQTKEGTWVVII